MYYSLIGFLATLILIITNYDVLLRPRDDADDKVQGLYRKFLLCVTAYYITDMLWGILDTLALTDIQYLDTEIYYVAMGLGVLFWTKYVVAYLGRTNAFVTFLKRAGSILFAVEVFLVLANLVFPVLFWFDESGDYHAGLARHTMLVVQIVIHLFTLIYALYVSRRANGSTRSRHLVIGFAGLAMVLTLSVQLFYPLLPLYTIGYMLATCMLRTFVIENEKAEYRIGLEASLAREQKQLRDLDSAWKLAYTDALTGVGSKLAYMRREEQLDRAIADGSLDRLAIVVFDVNGLKHINDTLGHEEGDRLITGACHLICEHFKHSPVFRVGGDEFAVFLENDDYEDKELLMLVFNQLAEENAGTNAPVVAAGIAEYMPGEDNSFERVFKRADLRMYQRKEELKALFAENYNRLDES